MSVLLSLCDGARDTSWDMAANHAVIPLLCLCEEVASHSSPCFVICVNDETLPRV